jgi:hypothetical protein
MLVGDGDGRPAPRRPGMGEMAAMHYLVIGSVDPGRR